MKEYSESDNFSTSISHIDEIKGILKSINNKKRITHIIETGTYLGTGSTKVISEALLNNKPDVFITIEANWRSWRKAKKNLSQYNFVTPIWGKSVPTEEAISFIENDDAIRNHEKYENIYIDGVSNAVVFYKNEILGEFGYTRSKTINKILKIIERKDKPEFYIGEDLLRTYLQKYRNNEPLIVLDSCGGIGLLEFTIVKSIMGNLGFYILLDDIFHLKHFRSYNEIQNSKEYEIISLNKEGGWLIAKKMCV
jgi:hypothetical protein